MTKLFKISLWLIIAAFIFSSCENEDDETIIFQDEVTTLTINNFIKENMEVYYLWNQQMPNLNVKDYTDPKKYFDDLLYTTIDRWSFITDDVDWLENYFAGIQKSFGYELDLHYIKSGSNKVRGDVQFVEHNSPAERAGIKRGDIIVKVNGEWLDDQNYVDVLYGKVITVSIGNIVNDVAVETNTFNLSAEELHINPIHTVKTFDVDGTKVGYLAYTSFIDDYNTQLEETIANFKAEGITELILDLRYNGGGAISSAQLMAEMIGPASLPDKVFIRTAYNSVITDYLEQEYPNDPTQFEDYFNANDNNLNLSRLYVLTTEGTASASEMVIYSLMPYMDVVIVGQQTHGKYYGSVTLKDENKKHTWAIQPIIMRAENSNNSINYAIGMPPNIVVQDSYAEPIGSTEDVMVKAVINSIQGNVLANELLKSSTVISGEKLRVKEHPLKYEMYLDKK